MHSEVLRLNNFVLKILIILLTCSCLDVTSIANHPADNPNHLPRDSVPRTSPLKSYKSSEVQKGMAPLAGNDFKKVYSLNNRVCVGEFDDLEVHMDCMPDFPLPYPEGYTLEDLRSLAFGEFKTAVLERNFESSIDYLVIASGRSRFVPVRFYDLMLILDLNNRQWHYRKMLSLKEKVFPIRKDNNLFFVGGTGIDANKSWVYRNEVEVLSLTDLSLEQYENILPEGLVIYKSIKHDSVTIVWSSSGYLDLTDLLKDDLVSDQYVDIVQIDPKFHRDTNGFYYTAHDNCIFNEGDLVCRNVIETGEASLNLTEKVLDSNQILIWRGDILPGVTLPRSISMTDILSGEKTLIAAPSRWVRSPKILEFNNLLIAVGKTSTIPANLPSKNALLIFDRSTNEWNEWNLPSEGKSLSWPNVFIQGSKLVIFGGIYPYNSGFKNSSWVTTMNLE